jgi:hypothetical protein
MPYCESCGQEVEAEWNVCPNCGHDLSGLDERTGHGGDASAGQDGDGEPTESISEQLTAKPEESTPLMTRRMALATGGGAAALLAVGFGALRFLPTTRHDGVGEEAWSSRQVDDSGPGRFLTGSLTLAPGEFAAEPFTVAGGAALRATVQNVRNGPLDIYTVRDRDIEDYRDAGRVAFVQELSQSNIVGARSVSGIPAAGDYWMIIDNTAVYAAEPTGDLTVDVEMGVQEP